MPEEIVSSEALKAARKTGILMEGEYKAHIWQVMSGQTSVYRWTVQRIATAESILHFGQNDTFEEAVGEADACLHRLCA